MAKQSKAPKRKVAKPRKAKIKPVDEWRDLTPEETAEHKKTLPPRHGPANRSDMAWNRFNEQLDRMERIARIAVRDAPHDVTIEQYDAQSQDVQAAIHRGWAAYQQLDRMERLHTALDRGQTAAALYFAMLVGYYADKLDEAKAFIKGVRVTKHTFDKRNKKALKDSKRREEMRKAVAKEMVGKVTITAARRRAAKKLGVSYDAVLDATKPKK